jgi:hypothetical protein
VNQKNIKRIFNYVNTKIMNRIFNYADKPYTTALASMASYSFFVMIDAFSQAA